MKLGIAVDVTPSARLGFRLVQQELHLEPEHECADLFTMLYEPEPGFRAREGHIDELQYRAWRTVLEELSRSATFEELHDTVALDHELSGLAVKPILEQALQLMERWREQLQNADGSDDDAGLMAETTQAVAHAVSEAAHAVEQVRALRAMGYSTDAGKLVSLAIDDRRIARLLELAMRVHARYGRLVATFNEHIVSRAKPAVLVRGVTLGRRLARVLPSQLAWLADHELEDLFLMKWLEGRLLVRDTERPQGRERGDLVVCVDESGSMAGERVLEAKAFAFALRAVMREQGRRCHLLSFSCYADDMHELPSDADAAQAVEWLGRFIDGGTDFQPPLRKAMSICSERSDILILTDGEAPVTDEFASEFLSWKRANGARLHMLYMGYTRSDLLELADDVLHYQDIHQLLHAIE